MANVLYPKFKQALLKADVDLDNDVRVILIDLQDYTYSATHEFLSSVPAAARVATSGALTSKTFTDGTFDSDDPSFGNVTGDQSEALILYQHTGNDSTARLIAYYDTGVTGLPVTPNGGVVNLTVNASGWFTL